jgi:hypothetical protein
MSADSEQDRLILDSVGRFLEREVKPHVHAFAHDDIYVSPGRCQTRAGAA